MTYYFGGKFNPFTKGHLSVVDGILTDIYLNGELTDKVVIGFKTGPYSEAGSEGHELCSSFEYRVELARQAIQELATKHPFAFEKEGVFDFVVQTGDRTWPYFQSKPGWWPEDGNVILALGGDEYDDFKESEEGRGTKWMFAKEIKANHKVLGFKRDGHISGTRVRKIFLGNPYTQFSEVRDFINKDQFDYIKKFGLYWQLGYEDEYRRKENVFLQGYDASKFPRPSATVDIILTSRYGGKYDQVLLIRRKGMPYKGFWALPGGFLDVISDESLEDAAERELAEEVNYEVEFKREDQFRTYSDIGSDPRCRIVDTVYHKYVDFTDFTLNDSKAGDDAEDMKWFLLDDLPRLAFNHRQILEDFINSKKE